MKPKEKAAARELLEKVARKDAAYEPAKAVYDLVQEIAGDLRALRKRANLGQQRVAELIGVSQSRISQMESGLVDYAPNLEMLAKFANACGARLKITLEDKDFEAGADVADPSSDEQFDVWITRDWQILPQAPTTPGRGRGRLRQTREHIPARFDFAHMQLRTHVLPVDREAYLRMLRERFGLATDQAVTVKGDEVAIDVSSITLGVPGAKSGS